MKSPGLLRRICSNLVYLLSGKAAAGLISLGYIAIAARVLGPDGYGVLALAYAFAMIVGSVLRVQPGAAVVRYGSLALAEGDHARLANFIRRMAMLEIGTGLAAATAAGLLTPLVSQRFGWSAASSALTPFVALSAVATIRSTAQGMLQLFGRFDLIAVTSAVEPAFRLVGVLVILPLGLGLNAFLVVWSAAIVAECAATWGFAMMAARQRRASADAHDRRHGATPSEAGLPAFIASTTADLILRDLFARLPGLTVGWVLGPGAAGLYVIAVRATNIFVKPAQLFADAAYAEFARHLASGDAEASLRRALAKAVAWSLAVALPLLAATMLFGRSLAEAFAGPRFVAASDVLSWLALACVIRLAVPTLCSVLVAQGRPSRALLVSIVSTVALYPLLPLLLKALNLVGAGAFALLQAVTALSLVGLFLWLPRHPLGSSVRANP